MSCRRIGATVDTPLSWRKPIHRSNRPLVAKIAVNSTRRIWKTGKIEGTSVRACVRHCPLFQYEFSNRWSNVETINRLRRQGRTVRWDCGDNSNYEHVNHRRDRTSKGAEDNHSKPTEHEFNQCLLKLHDIGIQIVRNIKPTAQIYTALLKHRPVTLLLPSRYVRRKTDLIHDLE